MPNIIAYIALILWPIAAKKILNRFDLTTGVILALVIPYLLLPVKTTIDLPLIPALDKHLIPALSAFFWLWFSSNRPVIFPQSRIICLAYITLILTPIGTIYLNQENLHYGDRTLGAMGFKDFVNITLNNFAFFIVPMVLGFNYLNTEKSHRQFLIVIAFAGLAYSLPVLWEIRMSPQLHSKLYGFFPHDFRQQIRQGGFRAVVFLGHGLLVAIFLAMSFLAIATLLKEKIKIFRIPNLYLFLYMLGVIIISKSLGALVFAMVLCPLIFFFSTRWQVTLSAIIVTIVAIYPGIRNNKVVPIESIVPLFAQYDVDRADSLNFRFQNENILLDKANERAFFGWGSWGRNRVYDEITGKDLSITDGEWIIYYGIFGWLGYLSIFGLLCLPILILRRAAKKYKCPLSQPTATLCLILAMNLLDILPNASLSTLSCLLSGAILGRAIAIKKGHLNPQ